MTEWELACFGQDDKRFQFNHEGSNTVKPHPSPPHPIIFVIVTNVALAFYQNH